MNTKPILFSTEMVQAILEGRKTQTRRVKGLEKFNQNPDWFRYDHLDQTEDPGTEYQHFFESLDLNGNPLEKYSMAKAPYKIGDILWVRESFTKVEFKNSETIFLYKANPEHQSIKWKLSIHMPKAAARIFLKVKNIRAERLKDISEFDAICEGIELLESTNLYKDYEDKHNSLNHARISFASLWNSINTELTWRSNPWVWVIEFERVEKPLNF